MKADAVPCWLCSRRRCGSKSAVPMPVRLEPRGAVGAALGGYCTQVHRVPGRPQRRAGAFPGGNGPGPEANPTIFAQALKSTVSNSAWSDKKPELLQFSLLPINQALHGLTSWDEDAIQKRGRKLFERALKLWPAPSGGTAS